MEPIHKDLRAFRRRLRWVFAWRGLAVGGTLGAVAGVGIAIADYFGWRFASWPEVFIACGLGAVLGFIAGILRPVTQQQLADSVDRRAGLKDRLGTAIRQSSDGSWGEAQAEDAHASLAPVRPSKVFPTRVSRWHVGWLAIATVAASIFLLGNSPILLSDQAKKDREELERAGKVVERVAKPERTDGEEPTPEEEKLAEEARKFARELQKGRLNKEEAIRKANELAQKANELAAKRFESAERLSNEAKTALGKYEQQKLKEAGIEDYDPELATASDEALQAEAEALQGAMAQMESLLASGNKPDGSKMTDAERAELMKKLAEVRERMRRLELSKKAKDFLAKLHSMPEMDEIRKLLAQAQKLASSGKEGSPTLTEEQVKELIRRLEELADKLKDEKAMREFLQKLLEALKAGCGG